MLVKVTALALLVLMSLLTRTHLPYLSTYPPPCCVFCTLSKPAQACSLSHLVRPTRLLHAARLVLIKGYALPWSPYR